MNPHLSRAVFDEQVAVLTDEYAAGRGWVVHSRHHPVVDVSFTSPDRTTLRLRLDCSSYDGMPPSVSLLAADGAPLTKLVGANDSVFNPGPHPATGRPFICMRGTYEYHVHPSHVTDPWENLRRSPAYSLIGLLYQLHLAWLKGSG